MTTAEITAVIVAITALVSALGVLIYTAPGRAWRMLVENLHLRLKHLEDQLEAKDGTIAELHEAITMRDNTIRKLRSVRSILENLLQRAGIDIPVFHDDDVAADMAPERRHPVVTTNPPQGPPTVTATAVVIDPSTIEKE